MRYLVVEPHADDAFLSLGGHIEKWIKGGDEVTIATIYSGTRKRSRDALSYAEAVGAFWVGMEAVEGKTKLEDPIACSNACKALRCMLLSSTVEPDVILLPVGIAHPEHVFVRNCMEGGWFDGQFHYYFDQPYSMVSTNREELLAKVRGARIESYLKPHLRKYRHIPLFRDQAKFFHFNPAESLVKTFEMTVRMS